MNDEDIPSFGGASTPLLPTPDKGKGRAPQNLASPGLPPPIVSGITNTPGGTRPNRLHVARFPFLTEDPTSYAGIDTLDEPVTVTIVRQLR